MDSSSTDTARPVSSSTAIELPAEILRIIFDLALLSVKEDALRFRSKTVLAVSHVSQYWHDVAVGMPELWEAVFIVRRAGRRQDIDALRAILKRGRVNPLHLDIVFHEGASADLPLDTSSFESEFWSRLLGPAHDLNRRAVLRRCKSLYLSGTYQEMHSVLKVFSYYESIASNPLALQWLKVIRRGGSFVPYTDRMDVVDISDKITHLRSSGIYFSSFPQGMMDTVILEDIQLEPETIRMLIADAGARRLTFRRVVLPPWQDIRPNSMQYLWAITHQSKSTRLEYLELDAIVKDPQCNRLPEKHSRTAFTVFYRDLFIPDSLEKLKSIKLMSLNYMAWVSLRRLLRPRSGQGLIFPNVETVALCNAQEVQEVELTNCLPINFPRAALEIST